MRGFLVGTALLALSGYAGAAEPPRTWSLAARPAYVFMGSARPTGGLMPRVEALRSWQLSEGASIGVGAGLGAFGFGEPDAARWLGILGGPIVSASGRPWAVPVEVRAALHLDAGRVPTCSPWGLCLLYSGVFPGIEGALAWAPSSSASIGASFVTRYVSTWGWSGLSLEPGVAGRWSF